MAVVWGGSSSSFKMENLLRVTLEVIVKAEDISSFII